MNIVQIYDTDAGASEWAKKLDAIQEEVKTKDAELLKVREVLDKLGISRDKPLDEGLLEYFRITQQMQVQTQQPRSAPSPSVPIAPIVKEPLSKPTSNAPLWCPNKEEWIKEEQCTPCRQADYNVFSQCYATRTRIRLGTASQEEKDIFTPTKPMPST
jgi:hypothetical protein